MTNKDRVKGCFLYILSSFAFTTSDHVQTFKHFSKPDSHTKVTLKLSDACSSSLFIIIIIIIIILVVVVVVVVDLVVVVVAAVVVVVAAVVVGYEKHILKGTWRDIQG